MSISKLSDLELLQSTICNNEQAFNELFERHWSRVYMVSLRYVKDEAMAMEITHDVFMNIWNKRDTLTISCFRNYVLAAASYHGIKKIRQKKSISLKYIERYQHDGESVLNEQVSNNNEGHEKMLMEELDAKVLNSLAELPKRCREIYLLSRKEELSISEIAEKLNISKRTVENQITIALKHLKALLKNNYLFFL
ncbi:RNA polymerase sigma factor [Pedobacter mucosus]|uniref:RNA polymerase sigma factor n=1 Tax=Pedobacter mucosus TaxID=2895286 RepID=UPI001EE4D541|nr:RNA polymerase sigma-70 factor [Pedobacter mucosus]UKT64957.1 RNA polymerase sigma-70 factor [Pedobacter mucosus]